MSVKIITMIVYSFIITKANPIIRAVHVAVDIIMITAKLRQSNQLLNVAILLWGSWKLLLSLILEQKSQQQNQSLNSQNNHLSKSSFNSFHSRYFVSDYCLVKNPLGAVKVLPPIRMIERISTASPC